DAWKPAVEQVVTELRQALEQGFAPEEVAEASKALLARLGQAADAVAGRPSLGLAMRIAMTLGRGRQAVAPAAERDLAARLLPGIEPAEVDKALQDLVHLDRGLILLTLPETKGADLPTSDALRAAWKTALETPLDPRAKQAAPGKILAKDPEPGKVASRTQNADLGVTTLVLENGVRVHVKPLDSVDTVQVRVRLFGGVPEETATNRGITEAAALAFTPGKAATRTLSPTDVSRYLAAREVRVGGGSNNVSLRLDVRGKAEQLPEGLRLAYLLLTQGKVDTESLAAWRRETLLQLEEVVDSVPMQARIGMRRAATGGDVRFALPTKAQIEAIDRETAEAWLDRILTQAPIEVAIVGRIEPDAAERLARTWFGSLPKRPDRWDATRARRRVEPPEGPIVEDVKVPTVTPLAVVLLGWRGVGRNETDAQLALVHAATILSSRLLRGVREERGLTYSIQSGYRFTDYSGLDGLLVRFTADPAKAADAAEVAKKIVLDFAAQGPTDEELRTVERQFRNQIDTEIQQPGFWISALDRLHANGRTLEDLAYRLARLRRIDREAVVKTLNAIVKDKRFARVIAAPGK
ncbi:MAG: M16 family metallopeptidase, partial [Planctomycetota bacterium]